MSASPDNHGKARGCSQCGRAAPASDLKLWPPSPISAAVILSTVTNGCTVSPRIPGRLNDRRTPLGELNWIFTAITDTIAWNVLPRGEAAGHPPGGRAAESQEPLASDERSQMEERGPHSQES